MIQIITNAYKDEEHPYENGFIHSRVLEYKKNGMETEVFVLNPKKAKREYIFENVKVQVGDKNDLVNKLMEEPNNTKCVHFLSVEIISALEKIKDARNVVLFVHGVEALKWNERIFPGVFSNLKNITGFCKYIIYNTYMLRKIRKFIINSNHNFTFVTVSEWMRKKAEKNWKCKGKCEWKIIPNIVNSSFFEFREKSEEQVYQILSIRPFSTGKYANDLSVQCIEQLKKREYFEKINFTIIGKGALYNKILKPLKELKNVQLENRFLNRAEILSYHQKNGLFLCPTRQDAQGVSMCEAMSSGLVPITLYNTAIPEFLPDDRRLICKTVKDMTELVDRLLNNPQEFVELSKKCSDFIQKKCGFEATVKKEMELFKQFENTFE